MKRFRTLSMYSLRLLDASHFDVIVRHRRSMFLEAGFPANGIDDSIAFFREWLGPRLNDGRYFGWGIVRGDYDVVAGLGMLVMDWAPHPLHPHEDRRGYILNLYVEPEHRRRGLAKELMLAAGREAVSRKISFTTLHATEAGRLLYETLGWEPMSEMYLRTIM